MYKALLHTHSGLRWIVLILLIAAIFNALGSKKRGEYAKKDKMINLFTMIFLHTQLLIGIGLSFVSPKISYHSGWMSQTMYRVFGMEHIVLMIAAIAIVTIGRKKAEKALVPEDKHKKIALWYTIALLVILAAIPWPFRSALGAGWF